MSHPSYDTPRTEADWARVQALVCSSFHMPEELWPIYLDRMGAQTFRVWRDPSLAEGGPPGAEIVACLLADRSGQWWGGRAVPMGGVAVVATAPEHRGTGRAAGLLSAMLREYHAAGIPLSTLYPAAERPYQKVGYEAAGLHVEWKADVQRVGGAVVGMPVRAVATDDDAPFRAVRARLRVHNGGLDRNRGAWRRLLRPRGATTSAWLFGDPTAPTGYTILRHSDGEGSRYDLDVQDHLALDAATARAIWAFYAGHRSIVGNIGFVGAPQDPLIAVLPDQVAKIDDHISWMARIVDLPAALERRGWPRGLQASLHLRVEDPVLPQNAGGWRLDVAGGEARVLRADHESALRLHVRGLASLYTGFRDPWTLRQAGLLEGDESVMELAAALFAGPTPYMTDYF